MQASRIISKMKTMNDYCRERFGKKLYKLSLDGGFTCPNRDGTKGTGGCIFCSSSGSGDFAEPGDNINIQIERAKKRVAHKNRDGGYIAYFQSFTSTYAPAERLEKIFFDAINHPDIDVLSVATRPDCLPDDVTELLERLNKIKPVWVELGLQTIHAETVAYIRRGYPLEVYDEAVKNLKAIGIHVVVHMILGLPGETKDMMVRTARYIGESGADGIKLQLLHVLKGTDLAEDYEKGQFDVLTEEEYFSCLEACLRVLPKTMVIHRLTGDGDKKILVAPLWSGDKKRVLNDWNRYIDAHHVRQGSLLE